MDLGVPQQIHRDHTILRALSWSQALDAFSSPDTGEEKRLNSKKAPDLLWPHLGVISTLQIHVRYSDLLIIIGASECSLLTSNQECSCRGGNWRGHRESWSSARTQSASRSAHLDQWHRHLTPDPEEDPQSAASSKLGRFLKSCPLIKHVFGSGRT